MALVLPPNRIFDTAQRRLADCFRVVDPMAGLKGATRSDDAWLQHDFRIIATTSKGAGGTAKTTTAVTLGVGTVRGTLLPASNVLMVNMDSQGSMEDRLMGKLMDTVYDGDMQLFKELNGLMPRQPDEPDHGQANSDILEGLKSCQSQSTDYRLKPPRVIEIDCDRLASAGHMGRQSSKHLYVMLSSEDISEWDQTLSLVEVLSVNIGGDVWKGVPGAFYRLMQMTAHFLGAPYVFVDMGPGNGLVNKNVLGVSHGIYLPLNVDYKAKSNICSLAAKLPEWGNTMQTWRNITAGTGNRYPLPQHQPKLLGVIFSRVGARGSVRPYNQFQILMRCYDRITHVLMPVIMNCNMALDIAQYQAVLPTVMEVIEQAGAGFQSMPRVVAGVVGLMRDFDQLRVISERDSVPVPFLEDHLFRTMQRDTYELYLTELAANPTAPLPPDSHFLVPISKRAELQAKVANVLDMTRVYANMINALW